MLDGKFLNDEDLAWNDIDYGNAHTQVKTGEALVSVVCLLHFEEYDIRTSE